MRHPGWPIEFAAAIHEKAAAGRHTGSTIQHGLTSCQVSDHQSTAERGVGLNIYDCSLSSGTELDGAHKRGPAAYRVELLSALALLDARPWEICNVFDGCHLVVLCKALAIIKCPRSVGVVAKGRVNLMPPHHLLLPPPWKKFVEHLYRYEGEAFHLFVTRPFQRRTAIRSFTTEAKFRSEERAELIVRRRIRRVEDHASISPPLDLATKRVDGGSPPDPLGLITSVSKPLLVSAVILAFFMRFMWQLPLSTGACLVISPLVYNPRLPMQWYRSDLDWTGPGHIPGVPPEMEGA
nr:hypothetical protein CFP56_58749 [Quercus suber]